jgi:hypothetical protein
VHPRDLPVHRHDDLAGCFAALDNDKYPSGTRLYLAVAADMNQAGASEHTRMSDGARQIPFATLSVPAPRSL